MFGEIMHSKGSSDFLFAQPSLTSGIARLLDLYGLFDAYNTSVDADVVALFADWNAVGRDIESAIQTFDESSLPKISAGEQYELFAKTHSSD